MYTAKGKLDTNVLLKQYSPLVRRLAHQMIAKLPANVELDDLVQVVAELLGVQAGDVDPSLVGFLTLLGAVVERVIAVNGPALQSGALPALEAIAKHIESAKAQLPKAA